ncbi:hypothetical protein [Algoriphagus sp. CAU 1675]|uniref:hypothetical protein n=1 Tax=Algoriphagus sp. CAU 1675 TaxID=3032597 RepID=UPI0023DB7533|nr:hypothetical protein [Algoriphagus sp. CAU 1675]MDF2157043.1 hypothetical protein [Algoriphagus sp. CAU 1675]
MKNSLFTLAAIGCLVFQANAQQIQEPQIPTHHDSRGYAILKNGGLIEGRIYDTEHSKSIKQIHMEIASGTNKKIAAQELHEFGIVISDKAEANKKLISEKKESLMPEDFIIYRNLKVHGKKELLLQLLNPENSGIIEVYYAPSTEKRRLKQVAQDPTPNPKEGTYYLSKNGERVLKVKYQNYWRAYKKLFKECPELMKNKSPELWDLEEHIQVFTSHAH